MLELADTDSSMSTYRFQHLGGILPINLGCPALLSMSIING